MTDQATIAEHWGGAGLVERVMTAVQEAFPSADHLTVDDLTTLDHFHARGFPATVELADRLPIDAGQHVLDIGCGLGGPARYMAQRFDCRVSGVDITPPFVEIANRLTQLVGMEDQVSLELGDGLRLPFADGMFDGAWSQHVTMNVADRAAFFGEAFRVLKPGAFFALTEHGRGPAGEPYYPLPWSEDGTGSFLATPEETQSLLEAAGFVEIEIEDTGPKYVASYRERLERAAQGDLPPLSIHVIMGSKAVEKTRNSLRNIEEQRTHPVQVLCRRPA